MIDITLQNFEAELIQASLAQPVLLDIWAPWCGPCKSLGPVLEKLETAYEGRFLLAKLNSDEQPEIAGQLSQAFGVRSIPFCVMFAGGQPVDGFVGALPESEIRAFLDKHVPSAEALEADAETAEAEMLAAEGDTGGALEKLAQAVATDPGNLTARYDYIKLLLEQGGSDAAVVQQAKAALEPAAAEVLIDQRMAALQRWIEACESTLQAPPEDSLRAAVEANKRDFDARMALAERLLVQGRYEDAMEELLEIIMRDKAWSGEKPRKTYVAILEILTKPVPKAAAAETKGTLELTGRAAAPAPSDPVVEKYRRKLSMALF